ncbi:hypothetical protein TNCT_368301 [Trichonephila clavata]|uniref:Uncharacterized protein n=1 Tax=Trichonephila clavata TaxID=2740835 RepID=A0A8X6GEN5_TRICU|nr:hypothetical protein TNCT_368301 [Trichonephila clavata]
MIEVEISTKMSPMPPNSKPDQGEGKAELELPSKWVSEGSLPCPVPCCHTLMRTVNSFRTTQKRPAESPILPAKLILNNNTKDKKSKPKRDYT